MLYKNSIKNFIIKFLIKSLLIIGCIRSENIIKKDNGPIEDLKKIPQNAIFFANKYDKEPVILPKYYDLLIQYYFNKYFEAWGIDYKTPDIKSLYNSFFKREYYGENKQKIEKKIVDNIIKNSKLEDYPSLSLKAITTRTANLRVIPTLKPFFKEFSKPGEGYPFDYAQVSIINGNIPIRVLHITEDREWAFVVGIFGEGWIQINDIAFVNEETINMLKNNKEWVIIIKDDVPLITEENSIFLYKANIGTIYPLLKEKEDKFIIKVITSNEKKESVIMNIPVSKKVSNKGFLKLNRENIAKIINNLLGQTYGWGGLYGNRDCSLTIKDLFSVFGIYLPRHSFYQFQSATHLFIDDKNDNIKEKIIKENGIPFYTLLWKKGHIMLYIGEFENKVIIFHNTWGIKTIKNNKKEGRKIIGKAVITTLEPGKERKDVKTTLLSDINALTNIIPPLFVQKMVIESLKDKTILQ